MADEKNKKIPKSDAEWEYPWNQATQTLGGHEVFWNSTPDKESYREFHPSGPYKEITKDGHKVQVVANKTFELHSNGSTITHEGTLDHLSLGGIRDVNFGGTHKEIAQNYSTAIYGQRVESFKDVAFHYTDNQYQRTSAGGKVEDHNDGFSYNNSKESKVCITTANRIMGTDGEMMSYTGGNWDTHGEQKGRLFFKQNMILRTDAVLNTVSQSDTKIESKAKIYIEAQNQMELKASQITLTADTKIILKVGGSTITITEGGISVESSGVVSTKGSVTNVQGGGLIAPPTTFK